MVSLLVLGDQYNKAWIFTSEHVRPTLFFSILFFQIELKFHSSVLLCQLQCPCVVTLCFKWTAFIYPACILRTHNHIATSVLLPPERLQMWLLKSSDSTASSARTRCHRCFFEATEKSNWFSAWGIIPRCRLLPPPLLLPVTLSTMDMLQKGPRTSWLERIAPYYHSWLFPSKSPCYDDEKLENCNRIPRL